MSTYDGAGAIEGMSTYGGAGALLKTQAIEDGVTTVLDPSVIHPTTLSIVQHSTSHSCAAGKLCTDKLIRSNELHIIKNRELNIKG